MASSDFVEYGSSLLVEEIMSSHSVTQLMNIASTLGIQSYPQPTSEIELIRSIQLLYKEEPCFATDKRHDCAEMCEWRQDCRKLKAVWLR